MLRQYRSSLPSAGHGYPSTLADIFISYAREDQERIEPLAHALRDCGWSVFWDRNIPTGQTWRSHIGQALGDAGCVIVAWSQRSIASNWVSEEADDARQRGVLVPVFLDSVLPPIGFRSIQAADLSDWETGRESPAFTQLVRDIDALLGGCADRAGDAAPRERPVRARRPAWSRRVALLIGGLSILVFTAAIALIEMGTPRVVDCDPIATQSDSRAPAPGSSSFWLEFEDLECRNSEGFLSGLAWTSGIDEPYIKVNGEVVWELTKVTCPSHPKVRLDIDPIRLKPGKNTIELWDSDEGGLSRDDSLGTVRVESKAGRYECSFDERFAHYVVTWAITAGEPE